MSNPSRLEIVVTAATWTFDKSTQAAADAQIRDMLRSLHALGWHPPEVPDIVKVDDRSIAPREDWFEQAWKRAKYGAMTRWGPRDRAVMELDLGVRTTSLVNRQTTFTIPSLVAGLATIPFTLATVGGIFYGPQWVFPPDYFTHRGFAGQHGSFGLAAVFRGDGHNVLVSRRWLTHGGPWRVLRGPNDTTFVQFYDLGAKSPEVAWSQAKEAYPRLEPRYDGTTGFVWFDETPGDQLPKDAIYDHQTQTTWVLAKDRSVDTNEMYWVALERFNGTVKPASMYRTVKASAYLFASEQRAKQHLHELWLGGHQVWFERGTERVRIDETYDPAPPPAPAWVREAEARESNPAPTQQPMDEPAQALGDEINDDEGDPDVDASGGF